MWFKVNPKALEGDRQNLYHLTYLEGEWAWANWVLKSWVVMLDNQWELMVQEGTWCRGYMLVVQNGMTHGKSQEEGGWRHPVQSWELGGVKLVLYWVQHRGVGQNGRWVQGVDLVEYGCEQGPEARVQVFGMGGMSPDGGRGQMNARRLRIDAEFWLKEAVGVMQYHMGWPIGHRDVVMDGRDDIFPGRVLGHRNDERIECIDLYSDQKSLLWHEREVDGKWWHVTSTWGLALRVGLLARWSSLLTCGALIAQPVEDGREGILLAGWSHAEVLKEELSGMEVVMMIKPMDMRVQLMDQTRCHLDGEWSPVQLSGDVEHWRDGRQERLEAFHCHRTWSLGAGWVGVSQLNGAKVSHLEGG
jgi:hypothetical protein